MTKSTIHRIITHHNSEGKSAILLDEYSELQAGFASQSRVIWQSHEAPAKLDGHDDLADENSGMHAVGNLIRVVDFPPRSEGVNHRTRSLDYGIVMEGEIELLLEDGSKTIIKSGDVVVQRGTMHQWNNRTENIARVIFVLLPASPVKVNGVDLPDEGIPVKFQNRKH